MNQKMKKLIILNIPYVIIGLFCSNIGEAWRVDLSTKLLGFFTSMKTAWSNPMPSFHPFDLCIGLAIGATLRLVVYMQGRNAKKYRQNKEYSFLYYQLFSGGVISTNMLIMIIYYK